MARPKNRSSCLRLITLKANISSRRLARARCVRYPFTCCFLGKSAISQQLLAVSALSAKVGWGSRATWDLVDGGFFGRDDLNAAGNQFGGISTSLPSPGWGRRNNPHSGDSANLCAITFRPKTVAGRVVVFMQQLRSNPAAEVLIRSDLARALPSQIDSSANCSMKQCALSRCPATYRALASLGI